MNNGKKMASMEEQKDNKKRKWLNDILIIIIIIILILLSLQRCGISNSRKGGDSDIIIGAGVKEGKLERTVANEETKERSNGKSEMTVRLNGYPVFSNGESEGNLNIENPAVNELYMNVEITLDSTGELIYESKAIPPNHYIDYDSLNKVLEKGTYAATAHVTLLNPDDTDTKYNSANFALVITIEN